MILLAKTLDEGFFTGKQRIKNHHVTQQQLVAIQMSRKQNSPVIDQHLAPQALPEPEPEHPVNRTRQAVVIL